MFVWHLDIVFTVNFVMRDDVQGGEGNERAYDLDRLDSYRRTAQTFGDRLTIDLLNEDRAVRC